MSEATVLQMIDHEAKDVPLEDIDVASVNCGYKTVNGIISPVYVTRHLYIIARTLSLGLTGR